MEIFSLHSRLYYAWLNNVQLWFGHEDLCKSVMTYYKRLW